MRGSFRAVALVISAAFLALPATSLANGLRPRALSTTAYSYYPSSWYYPVYTSPVYVMPYEPACVPAPAAPARVYATPTPAGPSATPATPPRSTEPPLSPSPGVTEQRSYFNAYSVAPRASDKPSSDRCAVGFWNLTSADVVLRIGDQTHRLPRGKSLKLDLGRQFVWQVDNREPQTEQVSEAAIEIVIRR